MMVRGTGTRIILCQLPPLELVQMFTGRWRAEEWEGGRKRFQGLTRVKIVDREKVGKKG